MLLSAIHPRITGSAEFRHAYTVRIDSAQQGTCFFYLVDYDQHFTKPAWQRRTLPHADSTRIKLLETGSRASIQTVDPNDLAAGAPARQQIDGLCFRIQGECPARGKS